MFFFGDEWCVIMFSLNPVAPLAMHHEQPQLRAVSSYSIESHLDHTSTELFYLSWVPHATTNASRQSGPGSGGMRIRMHEGSRIAYQSWELYGTN